MSGQFRKSSYSKHYKYSYPSIQRRLTMDSARMIRFSRELIINKLTHPCKVYKDSLMTPRIIESTAISTEASTDKQIVSSKKYYEQSESKKILDKRLQVDVNDFFYPELEKITEEIKNIEELLKPIVISPPLIKQRNNYGRQAMIKTIKCSAKTYLKPISKKIRQYQRILKTNGDID